MINILGIAGIDRFGRLMEAIIDRDPGAALAVVHELFHEGYRSEQFVMDMIQYVRNLIVERQFLERPVWDGMLEAPQSELEEMERLAEGSSPHDLQNFFSILLRSEGEIKRSAIPG